MIEIPGQVLLEITKYPLEPSVARLRPALKDAIERRSSYSRKTEKPTSSLEEETDRATQGAISSLILAILNHRAAQQLCPARVKGTVAGHLAALYHRLDSDVINITPFLPLANAIVHEHPDVGIWKLVLQLVDDLNGNCTHDQARVTPPTSLRSFSGTPRTSNSCSLESSSEKRRLIEDDLRQEFNTCSYVDVEGFFERYFEGKSWSKNWETVYNSIQSEYVNGKWTTLPSPLTESTFRDWLYGLQEAHFGSAPSVYCGTNSKNEMTNTSGEAQLDIFTTKPEYVDERPHYWVNVLVIGEHTSSKESKFLQMARYARSVFIGRPRRLFLQGFTLNDSKMVLYLFDRSGVLCANPFDIHEQPRQFIQVLVGYCYMSDEELGLDTFVEREDGKDFITISIGEQQKRERVGMEKTPISWQRSAAGRGTSCYRATGENAVVKFSWPPVQKSLTEVKLLQQAGEKKIKGVVQLIGVQEFCRTSDHRSNLKFQKRRRLKGKRGAIGQSGSVTFSSASSISSVKRNLYTEDSRRKKRQHSKLSQTLGTADLDDQQDLQLMEEKPSNVTECFVDRVLSCLVVKPAGRSLAEFDSILELLRAFRDSIEAHRSLFLDAQILHRDISSRNIIITDPKDARGCSGILIDLDLATTVDENFKNGRTGSQQMTGTLKYMAIEVLEAAYQDDHSTLDHTYRHDLESFFYVFLSICANHGRASEDRDPFEDWYTGTYKNMASSKGFGMLHTRFEHLVLSNFPSSMEDLKATAWAIRDALF